MSCRYPLHARDYSGFEFIFKAFRSNSPVAMAFLTLCVSIGHLHSPAASQIDQSTIHPFTYFHIFKCSLQDTTKNTIRECWRSKDRHSSQSRLRNIVMNTLSITFWVNLINIHSNVLKTRYELRFMKHVWRISVMAWSMLYFIKQYKNPSPESPSVTCKWLELEKRARWTL